MFEHREPDPRDDIYALACVTYELLTGRHPYERMSANQARAAGLKPPQPRELSRTQWRTLREALSLDRETRTPTVERFLAGMSAASAGPARPALLAGAAVAALVGVSAVGYYAWRTGRTAPTPPVVAQAGSSSTTPSTPPASTKEAPAAPPVARVQTEAFSMPAVLRVVAAVPCSLLVANSPENGRVRVRGYLAESVGVSRLREQLNALARDEIAGGGHATAERGQVRYRAHDRTRTGPAAAMAQPRRRCARAAITHN